MTWRAVRLITALLPAAVSGQATPAPTRIELANGLRVWVQEDHSRPIALVRATYKVGALNETSGATGTAHYVEHMLYRATEHVSNEDNYGYIDRIGGRYTGETSDDNTTFTETVPAWALESALRVTADRMSHALFDSVEFERERGNVVTEANGFSRSKPVAAFHNAVLLASFEIHPYRYSSDTWSQDNLLITRDAAREFWRRYYGPNNAVLSIVGDVDAEHVTQLVGKYFASLTPAPFSGEVRIVEPPQRAEKRVRLRGRVRETMIDIVWRAPQASSTDYPVLAVLDRVLIPRLKASVAAAGGSQLTTSHDATPYPFVYRIQASAAPGTDSEQIVRAIQREIERLRTDSIVSDLARARADPSRSSHGPDDKGLEAHGSRQTNLSAISEQLTARESFPWEVGSDLRDRIRAAQRRVNADDIQRYIDRWLRTSQRTVGVLIPGASDFQPRRSTGRTIVGARLEIPPMTTPPARRLLPTPVPVRALAPLAPLGLEIGRRQLPNNVVVRAARMRGLDASLQLRVRFTTGDRTDANAAIARLAAQLISSDPALRARHAHAVTTSLANDGWFDIRLSFKASEAARVVRLAARALTVTSFDRSRVDRAKAGIARDRNQGGEETDDDTGVALVARARMLRAVAPGWRTSDAPATALARLSATEVNAFLSRHLKGGTVTASFAGPLDVADALDLLERAFLPLASGARVDGGASPRSTRPTSATTQRVTVAGETQVTVLAGLPGTSRTDPDARALEVLNYIVGVPYYGGRLGWALTKAGLTYSSAATTTFGTSTGYVAFTTICDTRNADATVQAIREIVAGLQENGVEEWEVAEAKAFILGRMLLDGPGEDSGVDRITTALLDSETQSIELLDRTAWSEAYLAVTRADVNAAAKKYYRPEALEVVAMGAVPAPGGTSAFATGTFGKLFEP